MKKATQKRAKRSYRTIGVMTVLSGVISVLFGVFVSLDACLSAVFGGVTLITLSSILSAGVECAVEIRREKTETGEIGISGKKDAALLTKRANRV